MNAERRKAWCGLPPFDRRLVAPGLGPMMGDEFRLGRRDRRELTAQSIGDLPVQDVAPASEQSFVGGVLDQRVLEGVVRMGGAPERDGSTASSSCANAARNTNWYRGRRPPATAGRRIRAVLAYLSRYTHRTAIANSRLVAFAGERVTFEWKDYRAKGDRCRYKLMTLNSDEFIRRFLIHVLPDGFHRIRHYGLFANANRANNIALARQLLAVPDPTPSSRASDHAENGRDDEDWNACPCCGGRMILVEAFEPGCQPRFWPLPSIGLDSS